MHLVQSLIVFSTNLGNFRVLINFAGMKEAQESTEKKKKVVVQKTKICNHGQARYKLASALSGTAGYDLTDEFKSAIGLLPSQYSAREYTRFLDSWGTVSPRQLW